MPHSLAILTFAAPLWGLALAGAVGAPLLAHLLSRQGGRLAVFPAVRFVQQAVADVARILRPRHWLLLAIRILILALIVAAFTQPVWYGRAIRGGDRGYAVAVILDRSASMTRTARGAALFDEARRRADQLLGGLDPAQDRAVVILVDQQPTSLLPEPSANFTGLRTALAAVEPTFERGRLVEAVRLAREMFAQSSDNEPTRTLRFELFTDAQATQHVEEAVTEAARAGGALTIHEVGSFAGNLALFEPSVSPTRPIVNQRATLGVRVANFTDRPAEPTVVMRLGDVEQRQTVAAAPFSVSNASFIVTPGTVGQTIVQFTLEAPDDAMDSDDRTGLVIDVAPARPVTIITTANPANPDAAVYFVSRALAPARDGALPGIDLTIASPAALLEPPSTDQPRVYVLVEAGALNTDELAALERRLASGDGVLWIADSPAAAQSLRVLGSIAPVTPDAGGAWFAERPVGLAMGRFDDPVLEVFEGPARAGLIDHTFNGVMLGVLTPSAEGLLTFDDGRPALATRWSGAGRLAVLAADVSPVSSDFAKSPAFVPLLHQLVRHLAPGQPTPPNLHPGDVPDAATPGLHATDTQTVWIEIDPDESDLRLAEVEDVEVTPASTGASAAATFRPAGIELWPYLMLAALVLAAIEPTALLLMGGGGFGAVAKS